MSNVGDFMEKASGGKHPRKFQILLCMDHVNKPAQVVDIAVQLSNWCSANRYQITSQDSGKILRHNGEYVSNMIQNKVQLTLTKTK